KTRSDPSDQILCYRVRFDDGQCSFCSHASSPVESFEEIGAKCISFYFIKDLCLCRRPEAAVPGSDRSARRHQWPLAHAASAAQGRFAARCRRIAYSNGSQLTISPGSPG